MAQETDLFSQVNRPQDPNNLTDLEKKHLPVIDAPDTVAASEPFEVIVEVGKLLAHPNEHGHYINFIDLYADEVFLTRLDLTPVKTKPTLRVPIVMEKTGATTLRAFEFCNLHGTWEGTKQIRVG